MRTYYVDLNRLDEDETPVTIEYRVTADGCPCNGWDEPGWAPEIEIIGAWQTLGNKDVILTDAEDDKFTDWIVSRH